MRGRRPGIPSCAQARPAWYGDRAGDSEVKVLYTRQGEGVARGKGVAGDCESEGDPRPNAGLTNSGLGGAAG
jgi:hypothetical protein